MTVPALAVVDPVFTIEIVESTEIVVSWVSESLEVSLVASTVLVIVPASVSDFTFPVSVNVADGPPAVIVPIVHVLPLTEPTLGVPYVTSSSSAGKVSRTNTFVASDVPPFETVIR